MRQDNIDMEYIYNGHTGHTVPVQSSNRLSIEPDLFIIPSTSAPLITPRSGSISGPALYWYFDIPLAIMSKK